MRYCTQMVPRIGKGRRLHVYLAEWMEHRRIDDKRLAERLDVDRVTVTRWRKDEDRLDPSKMSAIAEALDLDDPRELFSPPDRPSLDAIVAGASAEIQDTAADIVRRLVSRK